MPPYISIRRPLKPTVGLVYIPYTWLPLLASRNYRRNNLHFVFCPVNTHQPLIVAFSSLIRPLNRGVTLSPLLPMPDFVRISTTGRPHFVRSQSFSHHHHQPRHYTRPRCPDDCACVSVDDWNNLVERERSTRSTNEKLARENRALKGDLHASHQENHRLQDCNRDLQGDVDQLRRSHSRDEDISAKFRRRMAALKAEADNKDHIIRELQKESGLLDTRVRELTETVSNQAAEVTQLVDEVSDLRRAYKKERHELGVQTEKAREAWSLVDELRRQLARYRDPLPFRRRRYDFV
ncbi:hypothetical protein F5Y19DRAFT_413221 [Xylariaceae sp. FL1651]|nr:hypothetical protein F5Y19DRAFT_413221 [Xylariaceae sp. FL1651]